MICQKSWIRTIETTFWDEGFYIDDSLASLNHHLRDHRTNQLAQMEPKLFDLLFSLQDLIGFNQPIHVFSGYRSPKTNAMLATRSSKVAKKSLHMQGKAMDLRVPGVDLKKLHKAAISLQAGGVGFYPRSGFIHLDVGRVRYW